MAVSLKRGLWTYVRKHSDSFWLQLATDDDERAAAALERAIEAIRSVPHPNEPDEPAASYVSDIELVPGGPCVACDFKDLPDAILRSVLDAVVASLEADGIDGTLQPPRERKDAPFWTVLADGHHVPPYPGGWALLVARDGWGPGPTGLPAPWIEPLSTWVLEGRDDELFWAAVVDVAFQLPTSALAGFLARPAYVAGVAGGDKDDRLRVVDINNPHIVVAERGPSMQGDALDLSAERLRALARELAPHCEYVALDYPAARTRFGEHQFPVHLHSFTHTPRLCVPASYPWQVLSRAHAEALPDLPGDAAWVDDEHVEVALGDPQAWMDTAGRAHAEREADAVLAPLLRSVGRGTIVRGEPGTWGTVDDVRAALARVSSSVQFGDLFLGGSVRGEIRAEGAFVTAFCVGRPPQGVQLVPSHADRSAALVDDLVGALVAAAHGEVAVRHPPTL